MKKIEFFILWCSDSLDKNNYGFFIWNGNDKRDYVSNKYILHDSTGIGSDKNNFEHNNHKPILGSFITGTACYFEVDQLQKVYLQPFCE